MKFKNILIGSLLTLSIALQAKNSLKTELSHQLWIAGFTGFAGVIAKSPKTAIIPTLLLIAHKCAIELDKKDQRKIESLTQTYGKQVLRDYSALHNNSTCTSFSHDPYKWLKRRYNAPRYTESKVSSKDVDLGGLINPW